MIDYTSAQVEHVWAWARISELSAWSHVAAPKSITILFYRAPEDRRLHAQYSISQANDIVYFEHRWTRAPVAHGDQWEDIEEFCEAIRERAQLRKIEIVRIDLPLRDAAIPEWVEKADLKQEPGGSA